VVIDRATAVRSARTDDADTIVSLLRGAFEGDVLGVTPLSCSGIVAYVRDQIHWQSVLSDPTYFVAQCGADLIGTCEVQPTAHGVHLAYIAVAPGHRGRAVGSRLLAHALAFARTAGRVSITLDVAGGVRSVVDWYARLGLVAGQWYHWWRVGVRWPAVAAPQAVVQGLPQAFASFSAYGFGAFSVAADARVYEVGLLGPSWFRVTDSELLSDVRALGALGVIDPRRGLLVRSAGVDPPAGGGMEVAMAFPSLHMTGAIAIALERLEANVPLACGAGPRDGA